MSSRGLSYLKNVALALCVGTILPPSSFGQCNNALFTRTYDTLLTSASFSNYNLSFPKWSPDSGLLVSVKLAAEVSSQYGFYLNNADTMPATFQLTVGQQDMFSGPQLVTPFSNITTQPIGSYSLMPGQSMTHQPFTFLDKHVSSDSITDVAPFLGAGQASVSYMSFTYTVLSTYALYSYGANVANKIRFSLQYLYCKSGGVLPTKLTRWDVRLQEPRTAALDWSAANEVTGRRYTIQRSNDGKHFTTIVSLHAAGGVGTEDYSYSDRLPDLFSGDLYYRLQINDNGVVSYSAIRQVSLEATNRNLRVYPSPATDFIYLTPGKGEAGNWQVDILSANGSLLQRDTYLNVHTMRVNFRTSLAAGIYFVRALELRAQKSFTTSFVVAEGK